MEFQQPIGKHGEKFELEDWIDLNNDLGLGAVTIESSIIQSLYQAADLRSDYEKMMQPFHVRNKKGKKFDPDTCLFILVEGPESNLQLLLNHRWMGAGELYYEYLAAGDKGMIEYIRKAVPKQHLTPHKVVMEFLGEWATDPSTGAVTGLLIHNEDPPSDSPQVYIVTNH